jgi:KUP system potassium uptake protein
VPFEQRVLGLELDQMQTSFFVSRQRVAFWRERLAAMARNASDATDYFNIPANGVIELGSRRRCS